MADLKKRLPNNRPGEFFVDDTCIDCDTCRQLAPETFADDGDYSYVFSQPETDVQVRQATRALLACPTGSIGTVHPNHAKAVMQDFPLPIADGIYYCGFNSPDSFGANSYFIAHPQGNWLVDSPKFLPHLVSRLTEMGGVRYIFLTHQDDVAEADRYADLFGAERIIHQAEAKALAKAEIVIPGEAPVMIGDDFKIIPVPGHTRGHCVLLYRNQYLFTGDHLSWDRESQRLEAFRRACWYSWPRQIESMAKLQQETFEWILPGHGQRAHLPAPEMQQQLSGLIRWMKGQ